MKGSLLKENADFIFGIVVVAFAATGFTIACLTIKDSASALMPKLILAFIGIMGMGISINGILERKKNAEDTAKVSGAELVGGILLPGAFLVGTYVLINFLGFYVAEFLLIVALMYLQEKVTNGKIAFSLKRFMCVMTFAVCAMIVMYIIFHMIFALPTPKGILGF